MLRLEFADVCLRNALMILNRREDATTYFAPHTPSANGGPVGLQSMKESKLKGDPSNCDSEEQEEPPLLRPKLVEVSS
jgi:hypothetical protein